MHNIAWLTGVSCWLTGDSCLSDWWPMPDPACNFCLTHWWLWPDPMGPQTWAAVTPGWHAECCPALQLLPNSLLTLTWPTRACSSIAWLKYDFCLTYWLFGDLYPLQMAILAWPNCDPNCDQVNKLGFFPECLTDWWHPMTQLPIGPQVTLTWSPGASYLTY